MSLSSSMLCCWPGLPGLWYQGRWASLILAVGFAALLNLTLVATFIWTDLFQDDSFAAIAWPVLLLFWLATTMVARRNLPDVMSLTREDRSNVVHDDTADIDSLFLHARREYLKGHWQEAQGLLERQLRRHPRDVESRLMLATLFRHTRQFNAATSQLDQLQKYDPAVIWKSEIERERELLRLVEEFESSQPSVSESVSTNNDGFVRETRVHYPD